MGNTLFGKWQIESNSSDFGFWILDFGWQVSQSKIYNPKPKIQRGAVAQLVER
jgi:hypothetical protein